MKIFFIISLLLVSSFWAYSSCDEEFGLVSNLTEKYKKVYGFMSKEQFDTVCTSTGAAIGSFW